MSCSCSCSEDVDDLFGSDGSAGAGDALVGGAKAWPASVAGRAPVLQAFSTSVFKSAVNAESFIPPISRFTAA
eukprot:4297267-Prymnesium_polylepis.1